MDGSHHDWFEGRGPECVLMGYIDDATGTVSGRFYDYEWTMPRIMLYTELRKLLIQKTRAYARKVFRT